MGDAISIRRLHPCELIAKTTRIYLAREGNTSRSALPRFPDFVTAALRQAYGLHQREAVEPPFDRRKRGHRRRLAGLAQKRNVRHEGFRVERDLRFRERPAQLGDERFELGRDDRGAGPGDAVALPVARLVEDEGSGARRNLARRALDLRDARLFDAAEKSERHVQILRTRRPAAAQRVELARPAGELRAHLVVGPQREEQPHSSKTIASAAMPSPRPIAPSRSALLALMFTWPRSISRSAA